MKTAEGNARRRGRGKKNAEEGRRAGRGRAPGAWSPRVCRPRLRRSRPGNCCDGGRRVSARRRERARTAGSPRKEKEEPGRRARRTTACRPTIPTASSTSMRAGTSAGTGMARTTSLAASAFISAPSRGTVPGFARRRYGAQSYDDDAWWVGNPPRCRARKRRASSRT